MRRGIARAPRGARRGGDTDGRRGAEMAPLRARCTSSRGPRPCGPRRIGRTPSMGSPGRANTASCAPMRGSPVSSRSPETSLATAQPPNRASGAGARSCRSTSRDARLTERHAARGATSWDLLQRHAARGATTWDLLQRHAARGATSWNLSQRHAARGATTWDLLQRHAA